MSNTNYNENVFYMWPLEPEAWRRQFAKLLNSIKVKDDEKIKRADSGSPPGFIKRGAKPRPIKRYAR
jgi:hypothetical protein